MDLKLVNDHSELRPLVQHLVARGRKLCMRLASRRGNETDSIRCTALIPLFMRCPEVWWAACRFGFHSRHRGCFHLPLSTQSTRRSSFRSIRHETVQPATQLALVVLSSKHTHIPKTSPLFETFRGVAPPRLFVCKCALLLLSRSNPSCTSFFRALAVSIFNFISSAPIFML